MKQKYTKKKYGHTNWKPKKRVATYRLWRATATKLTWRVLQETYVQEKSCGRSRKYIFLFKFYSDQTLNFKLIYLKIKDISL